MWREKKTIARCKLEITRKKVRMLSLYLAILSLSHNLHVHNRDDNQKQTDVLFVVGLVSSGKGAGSSSSFAFKETHENSMLLLPPKKGVFTAWNNK